MVKVSDIVTSLCYVSIKLREVLTYILMARTMIQDSRYMDKYWRWREADMIPAGLHTYGDEKVKFPQGPIRWRWSVYAALGWTTAKAERPWIQS